MVLLATAAVVAIGACGYPTFSFDPVGTGGMGTGGMGTGGMGTGGVGGGMPGTGGESVTSTVAVTSAASVSSSGAGCMPTGVSTCTPTCGCSATQKCAITDETVGTMTCITAGPVADWAKCNANQDCSASSFCDHTRKVCKPICDGAGQCPSNAQCIPAKQSDGVTDINGLKVCTAHCNPTSAAPCGPNITCFYDSKNIDFDCASGSNLIEGVTCVGATACAKGLVCAGTMAMSTCAQWCTPINKVTKNPACPTARPYCDPVTVTVNYEGTDYGICSAP
jgi:hypothetical protein